LLPYICFPRQVRQFLNEDIVKDLMTSASAQSELEREFQQLTEDRNQLRDIFKQPNPRVCGRERILLKSLCNELMCPLLCCRWSFQCTWCA